MSMAKHMVRVAVLVGMVAGGVAQAYVLEDGEMLRGSQDRSGGDNRGPGSLNSGPGWWSRWWRPATSLTASS